MYISKKGLGYEIRQAVLNDFDNGLYDCLSELSSMTWDKSKLKQAFLERNQTNCIFTYVAYFPEITEIPYPLKKYLYEFEQPAFYYKGVDKVIGTASLILEPKFLHNSKKVAHIEDVVVKKEYRGHGIGEQLVKFLIDFAKGFNSYKIILNCNADNIKFYEKCGFRQHDVGMRLDIV